MNMFMPVMIPDKVNDYSEQVKRIASFLPTSLKKKTLGNVIFAEAGLYSDGDGGTFCSSCRFRLENINSSLNLIDVCKSHLSCSPNCNVALEHFKASKCSKTVDQVKANLYALAAAFTNKTGASVNVFHNEKDCQHPSPSRGTVDTILESPFISAKAELHENSVEEKRPRANCGIPKTKSGITSGPKLNGLIPIASASTEHTSVQCYQCSEKTEVRTPDVASGYSEASAKVGEDLIKNGAANDNFSEAVAAAKTASDSKTREQLVLCYQQSVEARIKTFAKWPVVSPVKPDDLAEAGFIYEGKKDNTRCVFCWGRLCEWEVGDVPELEHAKHFPLCKRRRSSSDESINRNPKRPAIEFDDCNISLGSGAASGAHHPGVGRKSVGNSLLTVEEITKSTFSNHFLLARSLV